MPLIIEDGTIVAGANSYVDDAYFVSFASARGIDIPVSATDREHLLIGAMDYIESYRGLFKGFKVSPSQELQFPKTDVEIDGYFIDSNTIPVELKKAQCQAAIESISNSLFESNDGTDVKKEKLDVLEVEYFERGSSGAPIFAAVLSFLDVLLKRSSKTYKLRRV